MLNLTCLHYFGDKALLYTLVDYAEALNLFLTHNNRYNDGQNMLPSINQLQEDCQYVCKLSASNTNSNSEADFEYINNSITKTMKNVFLSVISSITYLILSGIMTILLFLSLLWSVVLTILAFNYFILIKIAKIQDGKTYPQNERIISNAELLQNNDKQPQFFSIYCILCN